MGISDPIGRAVRAIAVPSILIVVWHVAALYDLVGDVILPGPTDVGQSLLALLRTGSIATDLAATAIRVAVGLACAVVLGIPAGLALGYWRRAYAYLEKPLHALRSVPATALFPLLLIAIGVGEAAIVVLAAYPSFLIVLVNTVSGVSLANDQRVSHARALGLSGPAMVREVLFFEALPSVFNGVRTAVSYTLVLVVAVEMFVGIGQDGLGRAIYEYQATYRVPEAYAMIGVAGLCGISLNAAVTALEHRMLRWVPHVRAGTN